MNATDIFTALGVVMAGLAALLSGVYSKRSIEFAARAQHSAIEANGHALEANTLSANSLLDQYFCNVRMWADEACDQIAKAKHALDASPNQQAEILLDATHRISALVDRGRWFFPNLWSEDYGQHKEPAYRGIRQPILDCLVEAYQLVRRLDETRDSKYADELTHCQRSFVSEVQQVLNPRRRQAEIERVDRQFAESEKLRTGAQNMGSPVGNANA